MISIMKTFDGFKLALFRSVRTGWEWVRSRAEHYVRPSVAITVRLDSGGLLQLRLKAPNWHKLSAQDAQVIFGAMNALNVAGRPTWQEQFRAWRDGVRATMPAPGWVIRPPDWAHSERARTTAESVRTSETSANRKSES